MPKSFRVFVSATTKDLGSHRTAVAACLREKRHFEVIDEATFPTMDYDTICRHLWEKIQISDSVVFLIGFHFGGEPMSRGANGLPRSFTQIEWDFAELLGKPKHVMAATAECPFDNADEIQENEFKRMNSRESFSCSIVNG